MAKRVFDELKKTFTNVQEVRSKIKFDFIVQNESNILSKLNN